MKVELSTTICVLYFICTIGLITLKFLGAISIPWGIVLMPLWCPTVIMYLAIIITFAVIFLKPDRYREIN